MAVNRKFVSEALQYTYDKYIAKDPKQVAAYETELINIEVAKLLYDLRTNARLSQRELAKKVGTTASVICRLEDAAYEGHSLSMLKRIAAALDRRVEIRFVPIQKRASGRPAKIPLRRKLRPTRELRRDRRVPA
jgi:transcriptional regulator with XRE-family HTH domain